MQLIPSIDLRGGRCVRLLHGDFAAETLYSSEPRDLVTKYRDLGAEWIHVVDLDGAFGTGENLAALRAICAGVEVPVQTGGGVRDEAGVRARFAAGASFVILGTLLIEAPAEARALVERFGQRVERVPGTGAVA